MADNLIITERQKFVLRHAQLKTERASWDPHWKQLNDFLKPRSARFFVQDRNDGQKRQNNIYDSTGTRALRVLGAGLMGGATSPARPWFRLATPDQDLMKYAPVKVWLSDATTQMLDLFARSNTYRTLHSMYEQLGCYGTAANIVLDDFDRVIHNYPLAIGEYCLGSDYRGDICTMYREFQKPVSALVKEFGRDNCSQTVQSLFDRGTLDAWVTVVHVIEPRADRDPTKRDNKNMPFRSVYYEQGASQDNVLREGGFKTFRVLAPRWEVDGQDIYGSSPGMECLGDIKQLQHEQLRKAEAIDYQVKPPLQIPAAMKNREVDRLPGGSTTVDMVGPQNQIKTMFDVNLRLDYLLQDIEDVRHRINDTFYTDLFLMLNGQTPTTMTATEVAERQEEKLTLLGPVLERLHNELLQPLVDVTFQRLLESGALPPPPDILHGQNLTIEFVSVLAQAQRAINTNGVDRFVGNLGQIASFKPEVLDKFDADKWAEIYSDMLGVDPELIVPDDKVALIRKGRAQAQQQAAQQQQLAATADSAKKLAASPTGGKNALTDITNMFQGYGSNPTSENQ